MLSRTHQLQLANRAQSGHVAAAAGWHRRTLARPRRSATITASACSDGVATAAVRVRQCRVLDAPAVGAINAAAFGSGNFEELADNPLIQQLETRYSAAVDREVAQKVQDALQKKNEARLSAREYNLQRQSTALRAQLDVLQGRPAVFPSPETREQRRQLERWQRSRMFACIVAQDKATGALLGCVNISMMQPEAALPKPFPSSAPFRLFVSNMAVRPEARRRGVARALLAECERLGRRWGQDSLWLQVQRSNAAGVALYSQAGFDPVAGKVGLSDLIPGPWSQQLMCKKLTPWPAKSVQSTTKSGGGLVTKQEGSSNGAGSGTSSSSSSARQTSSATRNSSSSNSRSSDGSRNTSSTTANTWTDTDDDDPIGDILDLWLERADRQKRQQQQAQQQAQKPVTANDDSEVGDAAGGADGGAMLTSQQQSGADEAGGPPAAAVTAEESCDAGVVQNNGGSSGSSTRRSSGSSSSGADALISSQASTAADDSRADSTTASKSAPDDNSSSSSDGMAAHRSSPSVASSSSYTSYGTGSSSYGGSRLSTSSYSVSSSHGHHGSSSSSSRDDSCSHSSHHDDDGGDDDGGYDGGDDD